MNRDGLECPLFEPRPEVRAFVGIDMIERFHERAAAAAASVKRVRDGREALQLTIALTKRDGGKVIAAPALDDPTLAVLRRLCEENGLTLLTSDLRARADEIHTGLTTAEWGVAETGTLVLDSSDEDLRLATMLAQVHVAMLPASRIVADLDALTGEINALQKGNPSYVAFITGPSRTADIERCLTIGVHGPRELYIMIV